MPKKSHLLHETIMYSVNKMPPEQFNVWAGRHGWLLVEEGSDWKRYVTPMGIFIQFSIIDGKISHLRQIIT